MKKTSVVVAELVSESVTLQNQLVHGTANLSALARKIHTAVEKRAKRQVRVETVTVALHRHQKRLSKTLPQVPVFSFQDSLMQTGLSELIFPKTAEFLLRLSVANRHFLEKGLFITVTQGINEISIVALTKQIPNLLRDLTPFQTQVRIDDLANLTFKVPASYTHTPNIFYALLSALAAKHINIIELTTTSTEISLLVHKDDAQTALFLLDC